MQALHRARGIEPVWVLQNALLSYMPIEIRGGLQFARNIML